MLSPEQYRLKFYFYSLARRRRGVTVRQCAAAAKCSVSTWHRQRIKAAQGSRAAHHTIMRSLELANDAARTETPLEAAIARA